MLATCTKSVQTVVIITALAEYILISLPLLAA
jgi:hypothetical protein